MEEGNLLATQSEFTGAVFQLFISKGYLVFGNLIFGL